MSGIGSRHAVLKKSVQCIIYTILQSLPKKKKQGMTIDSSWLKVLKEQAPQAFCQYCPFRPKVAYIDGMPLLMVSENRASKQWSDYVRSNFAMCILRFFKMGCEAVVLAFDEYDYVPKAKSITQTNRAKAKAPYEFGDGQNLPCTMPQGFNDKLANRSFKRRVLDMICNTLVQQVSPMPIMENDKALIIDYSSCPIRFTSLAGSVGFENNGRPEFMTFLPPLGEADIKFLRWAELYKGDIMAHSVDGDFIPIALIRYELNSSRMMQEEDEDTIVNYKIALHRLKYKMPEDKLPAQKKQKTSLAKPNKGREYEYVNIPELYKSLKASFQKLDVHNALAKTKRDTSIMRILAIFIALTGTDFTRNLPHISPTTMWDMLHQVNLSLTS